MPSVLSGISTFAVGLLLTVVLVLGYTWTSTTLAFQQDTRKLQSSSKKDDATVPPLLPYVVPGLGSTIAFSNQKIGDFFEYMRVLSRKHGGHTAFSIMLSGTRTHFIFSAQGIASIFKARQLSRDQLDQQLALGMSKADAAKAFGPQDDFKEKQSTARIHSEHLLSSSAVNALTSKFMECFHAELAKDETIDAGAEVDLYAWLWQKIFRSSTTALCGSELLEMYPDFDVD